MNLHNVEVGESLRTQLCFSASQVSEFARLAGDENPIHHDQSAAIAADFEDLVVSGPQLSSRLMGMTATHFSRPGRNRQARTMLGLDFRFRFRRATYANRTLQFSWEVVAIRHKPTLRGELVFLAGRVRDENGADAVKAVGKVLVRAALA
jgi:acyl dehydratase